MLDFIDWLTNQEFGRRCILSVRDILSWVNFMNTVCERDEDGFMTMGELEEEEPEWDLRLDTVTAFIHAACLVYVDGIGSGQLSLRTTFSSLVPFYHQRDIYEFSHNFIMRFSL